MFGFPKKPGENTIGYSGSDTYKHIDKLINSSGKTLKIITPYLGIYYARMLLGISTRKKIYLLVSGDSKKKDEEAVKLLAGKGRHLPSKFIAYGVIVAVLVALARLYVLALCVLAVMAIVVYVTKVYSPNRRNIVLKIATDKFVHEKLYISDDSAIVGSANLTYSGTHKNLEHIEVIKDEKRIDDLTRHFDELWKRY